MSGGLLAKCAQAHRLMSARLDAPLAPVPRAQLWMHLKICVSCRRVDAQMDLMRQALRRLGS